MSFRTKIISLILVMSLLPYIFTMMYGGSLLREKYYENTLEEMQTQLSLNVERVEQYLQNLKRDMYFISKLDIMNDIYSLDIDRRISNILQEKKKELDLDGDFYLTDKNNKIIASSNATMIFQILDIKPFYSVSVYSPLDHSLLGVLQLDFSLKNITKFFDNSKERHYYLILKHNKTLYKKDSFKQTIKVVKALKNHPDIEIVLEQNQESFLNSLKKYEYLFLFALLFGMLIIAAGAYYFLDKLIKPVIELSSLVEKITKTQDYSQSITVKSSDEIGKLANAFNQMLQGIDKALSENRLLNKEIEETQREVVFTMGAIGESRSKETGNHVKRVAEYSKLLAKLYGLSDQESELLKQASPMHDIGKVAIPDAILNKPGRFNEEERAIMDKHAELGYEMLKHSQRPLLKTAAIVAYEHHEKWNGSGYPRGLKAQEIHIYGRITALADVFDALGSDRVYKKAWDDERIFALFKEESGEHFEPKLVDLFFKHLDKFLEIRDSFKDK